MECNKERAIHAMEIAKKRLLDRDYVGAKEMALKGKKLFPLDNISQLLAVCEVHCSAQLMPNGLYDWYKIIQVGPASDEVLVGKQYLKLVRLLHPDKNKFPGAEVAFKLVVEAKDTLSDRSKRIAYDIKRRHLVRSACPQESKKTNSAHNSFNNINRDNKWRPPQQPQLPPHEGLNFWTTCPFCRTHYQYDCNMLYKNVYCRSCSRTFMTSAVPHLNPGRMCAATKCNRDGGVGGTRKRYGNPNPPSMSTESSGNTMKGQRRVEMVRMNTSQNPDPCSKIDISLDVNQKRGDGEDTDAGVNSAGTNTPFRRSPHKNFDVKYDGTEAGFSSPAKKARVEVKVERGSNGDANTTDTNVDGSTSVEKEVKEEGREKERRGEMDGVHASQNPNPCSKLNLSLNATQRRDDRKGSDAESHSSGTRTCLQRSSHNKPVGKDNATKAGLSSPAKKPTVEVKEDRDGSGNANTTDTNTNASTRVEEVKEQGREKEQVEPSGLPQKRETAFKPSGSAEDKGASSQAVNVRTLTVRCALSQSDADVEYEYPDAEFHDFAMSRTCNNFQDGDIWALYSDLDTFPKYYASICKVDHNPLKVHINWLEACPKSEVERTWLDADFPISCGKFRVTTQNTTYDNPDYFSHMVSVRHHGRGNYYEILPEVGEVWAIYSNWSAGWTPLDFKTCKFDIVEIIEHRKDSTIVWPLRQVPDFRSVFMQEEDDGTSSVTWKVTASSYILFSHKIPAIRLIEECGEKHKEFWELDPASVPSAFLYHDK
ncbi:DNAJ heat shock N-terminal domain-containing protein-like [Rhynchospora pubera]|uniref:DNAJ heat shock N-terminal domain-containing protein-like n=1 Tax=Rhynchospora pubera TaxID=906938 RepID=A0AAV8GEC9_9POAL|nr:DNAJ heat shock N-terminal domain-containing protein-like [Rhynchospora pubera]